MSSFEPHIKPDICIKSKCLKPLKKIPPTKLPSTKTEETWSVKALPTDWVSVPVSKPSTIIENLYKKRKQQHEITIKDLAVRISEINDDIEREIRTKSEIIKETFIDFGTEGNKKLLLIDPGDSKDIDEGLDKDNFGIAVKVVSKIYESFLEKLNKYHLSLEEIEKKRSSRIKEALRWGFKELHDISWLLPYDLQKLFQHRILEINQMLLNNIRCYSELRLQLKIKAEHKNRLQLQKIEILKEKWKQRKRKIALDKLRDKKVDRSDCEALTLQTAEGRSTHKLFVSENDKIQQILAYSLFPIRFEDVNEWTGRMQNTIDGLDFYARKLIQLYKSAIFQIFNGYLNEFQQVTQGISELDYAQDEYKPSMENVTESYSNDLINLEDLWDSIVQQLEAKLQFTYLFLRDAAQLWDFHFQRLDDSKSIVLDDIRKTIIKNDKEAHIQEIKINIALDTLRQAPTEPKLQLAYSDVITLLDNLQNVYNSHYLIESKVVEKHINLISKETEILLLELELFLRKYPKDKELSSTRQGKRASQISLDKNESKKRIITQQMKQCEYQVYAVNNWMFGLRAAIETYSATCKAELIHQAETWTTDHTLMLKKRLEVKTAFHNSKYSRIKHEVYDIRLAELKKIAERISMHKAGIERELDLLQQTVPSTETDFQKMLEEHKTQAEEIDKKMPEACGSVMVTACIAKLNFNAEKFTTKMKESFEEREKNYLNKIQSFKNCSLTISEQMTTFLEGGIFNIEQINSIIKELKFLEKVADKKIKVLRKQSQEKEKKLVLQFEFVRSERFERYTHSLEEFKFNESTSNEINKLQEKIRLTVQDVKRSFQQMEEAYITLSQVKSRGFGKSDGLDIFQISLDKFVKTLIVINDQLYQPDPLINVRQENFQLHLNNNSSSYSNLLFAQKPVQNGCFMSKICHAMHTSYEEIEVKAHEFYKTHGQIINESQIQQTYNDFMKELLSIYSSYHLQCELLWLTQVSLFMKLILSSEKFLASYSNDFYEKQYEIHASDLQENYLELITATEVQQGFNKRKLEKVYDKLKPLYGYTKNRNLLEDIQEEMAQTLNYVQENNLEVLSVQFEEKQTEALIAYEAQLNTATDRLVIIYNSFINQFLYLPLIEQFEMKLNHLNNMILNARQLDPEGKLSVTEFPIDYWMILNATYSLQNSSIKNCTYEARLLPNKLQKLEELNKSMKIDITKMITTWNSYVENYIKTFRAEIEKILKLYTVKYDNFQLV